MTDLEITRLCAEAMGYEQLDVGYEGSDSQTARQEELEARGWMHKHGVWSVGEYWINEPSGFWIERERYNPLHDDAHAMVLVKKFRIGINPWAQGWEASISSNESEYCLSHSANADLNRAICECVAKMQASK